MTTDEIEILIDLDRLPRDIGQTRGNGKRLFEGGDEDKIIDWIESKIKTHTPPVSILLTGHLPNWIMLPVAHYIDTHDGIEKFRYTTPGMPIYTVFDYTTLR